MRRIAESEFRGVNLAHFLLNLEFAFHQLSSLSFAELITPHSTRKIAERPELLHSLRNSHFPVILHKISSSSDLTLGIVVPAP